MTLDPAWIALIGTLCGGLGLKLLEHYLGKSKVRLDEAAQLRSELRKDMDTLRADNKELEKMVDHWRLKYYDLREEQSGPKP